MKQDKMNLESQASLDYAERIARITPESLDAIRTAQADRSARFHAARRVLEKLRAWHPDCALFCLERLEEAAQEAKERADAKKKSA
jgi:hypothetical protein